MATRSSGPRRRPAPPHVQEKARRAQARQPKVRAVGRTKKRPRQR